MLMVPSRGQGVAGECSGLCRKLVEGFCYIVKFAAVFTFKPAITIAFVAIDRLHSAD
jgi:hypothetical protein